MDLELELAAQMEHSMDSDSGPKMVDPRVRLTGLDLVPRSEFRMETQKD